MDRKELVNALSKHLGLKAKYLGVPSFAYEIGEFTVTREGKILNKAGDEMTLEQIKETSLEDEFTQIEIAFPLEGHDARSIRNLLNMIYSKEPLIKKVYALEDTIVEKEVIDAISSLEDLDEILKLINENNCKGISFEDEKITYKFIKGDIKISSEFLSLLIKKAKELKYATLSKLKLIMTNIVLGPG